MVDMEKKFTREELIAELFKNPVNSNFSDFIVETFDEEHSDLAGKSIEEFIEACAEAYEHCRRSGFGYF